MSFITKDKKKMNMFSRRRSIMNITMAIIAFVVTVTAIITGSYVNDIESVEVGSVAGKKYVATRTVENIIATEKLKEEAAAEVGPLYKHDVEIENNAIQSVEAYFSTIDEALEEMETEANRQAMLTEQDGGTSVELDFDLNVVSTLPVVITEQQAKLYHELTMTGKTQFRDDITAIVSNAYEQRITDENLEKIVSQVEEEANALLWQRNLKDLAKNIAISTLQPNLTIDEEAIAVAKEQRINDVEPVLVLKDQKIVDEGEVVTEEAYAMLNELGLINIDYSSSIMPFVGSILVVIIGFVAICIYIQTQQKKLIMEKNKTVVIFAVYVFTIFIVAVMSNIEAYYLIPISLFPMLISLLVKTKLAIILNGFVCLFALFIFNGDVDFLVYSLITGSFSALLIPYTNKRGQMILVYVLIGVVHMITLIGVNMFFAKDFSPLVLREGIYAALVGVASVIVVVGSLPLWESLFGIDTLYKLLELSNPNNELMKKLMIEAPGTYHHSLVVANLAETAAYDIYANGALARVGAYYHDIGKLSKPLYFSENQYGENIHNSLNPVISAKTIIGHVSDGVEVAKKNKVPKSVIDIMEQHHGTSLVKYFYYKATQESQDADVKEEDFRYKGPIPQTKESAIVMLADTVEAAVRSNLGEKQDIYDVEKLIDALVKDKLKDGQLDDCRLDLKELQIIKKSFMKVFNGMYHDRIAYPKDEDIATARKEQEEKKQEGEGNDTTN